MGGLTICVRTMISTSSSPNTLGCQVDWWRAALVLLSLDIGEEETGYSSAPDVTRAGLWPRCCKPESGDTRPKYPRSSKVPGYSFG